MTSPEYRYEFRELLTGRPLGEIPLYGVNFSVKLSDGGNGQGYFKLDGSNLPPSYTKADIRRANAEMLEMTEPGRTEITIYRNDVPLLGGGGEIISQSYGSQGKAMGVYWRTWESSLEMVTLDEFVCPRIWTNYDQLNIARELWLLMQFQISSNVRVIVPPEYPLGSSKLVSLEINAWDRKTYRAVMDDLAKQDDGFDWRVVTRMLGDQPTKYLELGYPTIGKTSDAFFFEYGRNMSGYYYTRNLGGAGNVFYVTGEGSGQEAPVGTYQNGVNLGKNYRRKDYIINDNQLPAPLVQPRANMEGQARAMPIAVPSIELDEIDDFGEWWVGDWGVLSWPTGNERFPDGFETPARITQIEINPPSDNEAEKIKPTFQSLEGGSGD
jgi:hypothetical protein